LKNPHPLKNRLLALGCFLGAMILIFLFNLYQIQIINGTEYRARSLVSHANIEEVEASRGIITDRNGKVLVSNRLTYTLEFSESSFEDDETLNAAILRLVELCQRNDILWEDTLPVTLSTPFAYQIPQNPNTFASWLKGEKIPFRSNDTHVAPQVNAEEFIRQLREMFSVSDQYNEQQARYIVGIRYELETRSSYVLAEDVPVELISQVVDGHYEGVSTGISSARVYNTTYAAHILGRISRIFAEDWESDEETGYIGYKDKGYSMDALVGKGGVEEAFEEYLHGVDGTRLITTDTNGKITGELYTKEPQPGGTVSLTIDIDLQKAAEDALAKNIEGMTKVDGIARGGAAAVIGVGTGEVLALASYPTYNLETFSQDYSQLLADERLPMFNRAVNGTYAPGSTFKLCTSAAALEAGIITPSSTIRDRGIYTYYAFPQPQCWIYRQGGGTHGAINVSQAITVSCNYFFYEVGRLTGIDTLNYYASKFGLGQHTGIEIGDSAGALASPEYAEEADLEWTDGQTITAAIGQSYNLFTPLQMANYVATLVGGGDRYEAHLLKNVKSYDNSSMIYVYDEEPVSSVELSASTLQAIKKGTYDLTRGSLWGQFSRCVVDAGAKTGSAQVGTDIANGVFVAYAPYDDPEIAVAVVIEKGGAGSALATTAVDIINAYFSQEETGTAILSENTLLE